MSLMPIWLWIVGQAIAAAAAAVAQEIAWAVTRKVALPPGAIDRLAGCDVMTGGASAYTAFNPRLRFMVTFTAGVTARSNPFSVHFTKRYPPLVDGAVRVTTTAS